MIKFFKDIDPTFLVVFLLILAGAVIIFYGVYLWAGIGPALIVLGALWIANILVGLIATS